MTQAQGGARLAVCYVQGTRGARQMAFVRTSYGVLVSRHRISAGRREQEAHGLVGNRCFIASHCGDIATMLHQRQCPANGSRGSNASHYKA